MVFGLVHGRVGGAQVLVGCREVGFAAHHSDAGTASDGVRTNPVAGREGGGNLADLWLKEGQRRGLDVQVIHAERWREALLFPREQRHGTDAKSAADGLARAIIAWSGAKTPRGPLKHDAAEAIAIGLWGVIDVGWLDDVPSEVERRSGR